MTDLVIHAATEADMRAAITALGFDNVDDNGNQLNSWSNAVFAPDGTRDGDYAIHFFGAVVDKSVPTGTATDEIGGVYPTYDNLPGVYSYVRWNTGQPEAPHWDATQGSGITVYWRSDQVDDDGDPVPLPDWFPRIG